MSDAPFIFKCRRYSTVYRSEVTLSARGAVEVVAEFVDGALTDAQSLDTIIGEAVRTGSSRFADRHGRWTEIEVS